MNPNDWINWSLNSSDKHNLTLTVERVRGEVYKSLDSLKLQILRICVGEIVTKYTFILCLNTCVWFHNEATLWLNIATTNSIHRCEAETEHVMTLHIPLVDCYSRNQTTFTCWTVGKSERFIKIMSRRRANEYKSYKTRHNLKCVNKTNCSNNHHQRHASLLANFR